jgi:hypothetical protein
MLQVFSSGCCKSRSGCCICCYLYTHVSRACLKCFIYFQTDVANVLSGCCIYCKWLCCKCMFRMFHLFEAYDAILSLSVAVADLDVVVEEA